MIRRGIAFCLLVLLSGSCFADVCISTDGFNVEYSTDGYTPPLTSTMTQQELLAQLYQTMWERDRNRYLWLEAIVNWYDLDDRYISFKTRYDELYHQTFRYWPER